MATDILQQMLSKSSSNQSVSPELLETLGKQAAQRFLKGKTPLNESIVKLAAQYPGVQNEHVKRIAEFANNAVFQNMHTHSDDKNVHFDVADPGVIVRDLKDGGSPKHDGKTLSNGPESAPSKSSGHPAVGEGSNYRKPPGHSSSPSSDQGFDDFSSAFNEYARQDGNSGVEGTGEPISKTAAVVSVDHGLHSNPVDDVYDTHVRLQAAQEKLAEAHERFDLLLKEANEEFYQAAKSVCLDPEGPGLAGVTHAVKLATPNDSFGFQVLKPVAERLVKEGAVRSSEMDKTASMNMVLNSDHPLIRSFAGIVKVASEKQKAALALEDVSKGLEKTQGFLQSLR